ncbi:unnamed protein product [Penicillium viridicatum]
MFLCSWSSLCLNVPGPEDTTWKIFRRRVYLTALALLGPEFIFQIALSQWESARQSVADFEAAGIDWWTITHAFYADMGGFVLKCKDSVAFPINAKQLHYLIVKKYVNISRVDEQVIADKNKVDGMLRLLTIFQCLWFIFSICGRASLRLAITTGELTTAAFIVCSIATTFCWYNKPADVRTPEFIETDTTLEQILADAGDVANGPCRYTPLDFVTRKEWPWSLYWSNWTNILRKMHIVIYEKRRPVDRFQNTLIYEPSMLGYGIFLLLTVIYASIFPFLEARKRERAIDEEASPNPTWISFKRQARRVGDQIKNNSIERDPDLTVPLKAIVPIYVIGVVYCHARTYIFLEDILQLRSLPASAYSTVDWIDFWPHV